MNLLSKIIRKIRRNKYKKDMKNLTDLFFSKDNSNLLENEKYNVYTISSAGIINSHLYTVWKEKYNNQSVGCKALFNGTYRECKKYCKDHKIELGRRIYE